MVTLEYSHGWDHGGHLRIFAITREWVRQGAKVHFIALDTSRVPSSASREYLERLRDEGVITSFDEVRMRHPRLRGKIARAALAPPITSLILRPERQAMRRRLDEIAGAFGPDLIVYAARQLLWTVPHLQRHARVAVDWGDFYGLYYRRLLGMARQRRDVPLAISTLWGMAETLLVEGTTSRAADANVFCSPVDAAALSEYAGPAAAVRTVTNGIRAEESAPRLGERMPGRVIFTGNMHFPPNHYSAVWFIREVLPRIVARRPDVRFVVAGANPQPELLALAGPHVEVTGYVNDMRAEIARSALYVAPMTSGSGFKNKVVEALVTGTNVVGTPFAFEFLPDRLRAMFATTDDPERLAGAVLAALDDPSGNAATVERFWQLARDEYSWERVAERFAAAVSPHAHVADGGVGTPH